MKKLYKVYDCQVYLNEEHKVQKVYNNRTATWYHPYLWFKERGYINVSGTINLPAFRRYYKKTYINQEGGGFKLLTEEASRK